jgi:hypothetical protein
MRRSSIVLASAVLLLAGCGGDDDDQAQTVETTTTERSEDDSSTTTSGGSSDLNDVVVQLDDLPTGWSVTPPEETDDEGDEQICEGHDPLNAIEPQDEAESGFQESDFGPYVASGAAQYSDDDEASEVIDQFAETANACQTFTETDEDGTVTEYTISPLSFPDLGDETFAFRMSATSPLGPFAVDVAVARQGEFMVSIFNAALGTAPDSALTESLTQTMLGRL